MPTREQLAARLEDRVRRLNELLYDTRVPPHVVDRELTPLLAPDVRFTDPWQEAQGREKYRLGAAGFHSMFRFDFETLQVNVQLDADGGRARAIVDGVMHLKNLSQRFPFPLRTILVYQLRVTDPEADPPGFLIESHQEMWSFGDMLEGVRGLGWLYKNVFRRGFSWGFLGASWVAARLKGGLPR